MGFDRRRKKGKRSRKKVVEIPEDEDEASFPEEEE